METKETKEVTEQGLQNVSGGWDEQSAEIYEMLRMAGYYELPDKLYNMKDNASRNAAIKEVLNQHGMENYSLQCQKYRTNMYSVNGKLISHDEFISALQKALGLSDRQMYIIRGK